MKQEKNWWILLSIPLLFSGRYFVNNPEILQQTPFFIAIIVMFSIPAVHTTFQWIGKKQGILLLAALATYTYVIEFIAILTGFPHSTITYGKILGTTLVGIVPAILPILYVPLLLGARALGTHATFWKRFLQSTAAIILTYLVIEPSATQLHYWTYAHIGTYYNIPIQRFLGILLVGSGALALLEKLTTKQPTVKQRNTMSVSILLHLSFWTSLAFSYKHYLPAGIGALLLLYAAKQYKTTQQENA